MLRRTSWMYDSHIILLFPGPIRDSVQMNALDAHDLWMPVSGNVRVRPEFEAVLDESGLID